MMAAEAEELVEDATISDGRATEPLLSVTVRHPDQGLRGWVVVDSLVGSLAMGGTRMTSSVDEAEVRALARAMSVKLGLVGLPIGGAKAGIVAPPPGQDDRSRDRLLRSFGRTVAPLLHGGVYLGCDQGTTHADRDLFLAAADYDVAARPGVTRLPVTWKQLWHQLADITGFGVATGVLAALKASADRAPRRVVVQGFGTVGRSVAKCLADKGHHVVAIADVAGTIRSSVRSSSGLPIDQLVKITDAAGTVDRTRLPDSAIADPAPEAWLDVHADVLVLAAGGGAIHRDNVGRVQASLVAEGGNLCCTAEAKQALRRADVTVLPDVVINVGAAAATGCVLTGLAPCVPASQLVVWLFAWVGAQVQRNTLDILDLLAGGSPDPVEELFTERRAALAVSS